jgi:uncharacterized membrane protein
VNGLFPPGVPQAAHGIGAVLLGLHVGAGGVGLVSGAVAMATAKGRSIHRKAGTIFFIAMMAAGTVGIAMVPFLPKWSSVIPGLFATYLIATGWMTTRRPSGQTGRFERTAFGAVLGIGTLGCLLGLYAFFSPAGRLSGAPPLYYYVVALLPAFAAFLDWRVISLGGIRGAPRLSRHIWRMSTGMFVVSVSFFPARPQMFPAFLRDTRILWLAPIAVVAVMAYWLIKVRQPKWLKTGRVLLAGAQAK